MITLVPSFLQSAGSTDIQLGSSDYLFQHTTFFPCENTDIFDTIKRRRYADIGVIVDGFCLLVGVAMRQKATYISTHMLDWPFGDEIIGFLVCSDGCRS